MPKKKTDPTPTTLNAAEIARAVTNDPALALDSFTLGDVEYKLVDLPYDDYIVFVSLLEPLINTFVKGAAGKRGISLNGLEVASSSEMTVSSLLTYCHASLPQMVQVICRQTDPAITTDAIKVAGKTPFRLAEIVLKQIIHNNIIKDFASFFQSV